MQGVGETDGLEAKAKASGASELFIADLREEFVRDYIYPCLRAGAIYERKYLLGTSMARPIIAKVKNYLKFRLFIKIEEVSSCSLIFLQFSCH